MNNENKIALAQINTIVGDIEFNKNKAIENIKKAIENKADLIIFPQLYLSGNPLGNILSRYTFIFNKIENALEEIKEYSSKIAILIGFPKKNEENFQNSFAFIKNKNIEKINLNSNKIISVNNINYRIIFDEEFYSLEESFLEFKSFIYPASIISRLNKTQKTHSNILNIIKKFNKNFIFVNQVGANDELVFDGFSRVYDTKGQLKACAKEFIEDIIYCDFNKNDTIEYPKELLKPIQKEFSLDYSSDLERTYNSLILAIKDYFSKNGFKKAVLGLSGGLDSTICAVLLADALGKENVLGISMPSKLTSNESKNDAAKLSHNLGINYIETTIKELQDIFGKKFDENFSKISEFWNDKCSQSYTQDNIQARSRAMIIWGVANEYQGALPIATSDKSEAYMGYATINGDMSGGFAPILDVTKTKLFALARWMNENRPIKNAIPESIILKRPGAELAINPKTGKTLLAEEALMPYEFLDEVIWRIENYNQSIDNMMKFEFIYEKNNVLDKKTKQQWLEKFFRRLNTALYKWHIVPPFPIIDTNSINSREFSQPITSNIDYSK